MCLCRIDDSERFIETTQECFFPHSTAWGPGPVDGPENSEVMLRFQGRGDRGVIW